MTLDCWPSGLAHLGPTPFLLHGVAEAQVVEGPVGGDVEIDAAGEIADERGGQVATAAERSAAKAEVQQGEQGTGDRLLPLDLGGGEVGRGRLDFGTLKQSRLEQGWQIRVQVD